MLELTPKRGDKILCGKMNIKGKVSGGCGRMWVWVYDDVQKNIIDRCPYCWSDKYTNISILERAKQRRYVRYGKNEEEENTKKV